MDDELLESVGAHVTRLGGRAVADLGHEEETLEAATNAIVDTLRLSPVRLQNETDSQKRTSRAGHEQR